MRFKVWDNHTDPRHSAGNHAFNARYMAALEPQTKAMNDQHIKMLAQEWLAKNRPPANIAGNPGALRAWQQGAERKAREYAVMKEPKRFLNPLLRPMNGIKADDTLRRNTSGNTAILSSSWVKDGTLDATGNVINIDLGNQKYTYGTTPETIKNFYSAKSLGHIIGVLSHSPAGTVYCGLKKLWDVKKEPWKRPKRKAASTDTEVKRPKRVPGWAKRYI